jgi:hypothetical protein
MNLRQARCSFSRLLVDLLLWLRQNGQDYALDEGMNHQGTGHMVDSLHYFGCAQDIIFYDSNGSWLSKTEDYKKAGDYWKSLHPDCHWGGDFAKPDGDHFSYSPKELFNGRA